MAKHFSFGPFLFDPLAVSLMRGGHVLRLSSEAEVVLASLIEQKPRIVPAEELIGLVSKSSGQDNQTQLTKILAELRTVLGDDPNVPVYIKSWPGRGYSFIATLKKSRGRDNALELFGPVPGFVSIILAIIAGMLLIWQLVSAG